MNSALVNKIKKLCRERDTSLTKLEIEFGWGNGTIGKWAKMKKSPPIDRLATVAERLGTSVSFLVSEEFEEIKTPLDLQLFASDREKLMASIDTMSKEELLDFIAKATEVLREK